MMLFALEHAGRGGERGPQFLLPLLFVLLVGLIVFRVIRHRRGGGTWQHGHGSPMLTLEDLFARGEIDQDEFEHRKAVLNGADVVPPAPQRAAAPTAPTSEPDVPEAGDVAVEDDL